MFTIKACHGFGLVGALALGLAFTAQASANPHHRRHHHGYAPHKAHHHAHYGYRHRAYHRRHHARFGGYAGEVGYASGGDYIGQGVVYNRPVQAAPAYAPPVARAYQVPVTVNRVVTRAYQAPVTRYQAESRTEYVPVTRTYMRPVTVMQTFQRQEVVPTVEYRTVRQRCNCSWDF